MLRAKYTQTRIRKLQNYKVLSRESFGTHSTSLAPMYHDFALRSVAYAYLPIYLSTYLLLMHTRSRALAFHICDPTRTNTVKARRCQHVCQRNKRNPSTCEIGRATTPGIETRRLRRTFYGYNSRTSSLL